MPSSFGRYDAILDRTFSLRAFNNYETEINEHFWSFKVISENSRYTARTAQTINPLEKTSVVFHASGPDSRRIPPNVSDWLDSNEKLENWLRLSALVSASSYLEIYLRQSTRSALMSDPYCKLGTPRIADGVKLLKSGIELPFQEETTALTKGDWNSRSKAFERIFGDTPPFIKSNISSLEKIRNLRNNFAHGFGRDLSVPTPIEFDTKTSDALSQATFIKRIGLLSKAAAQIDKYLLKNFIGNFELIYFYHELQGRPPLVANRQRTPARVLQRSLNSELNTTVSTEFCEELIQFYDSA